MDPKIRYPQFSETPMWAEGLMRNSGQCSRHGEVVILRYRESRALKQRRLRVWEFGVLGNCD